MQGEHPSQGAPPGPRRSAAAARRGRRCVRTPPTKCALRAAARGLHELCICTFRLLTSYKGPCVLLPRDTNSHRTLLCPIRSHFTVLCLNPQSAYWPAGGGPWRPCYVTSFTRCYPRPLCACIALVDTDFIRGPVCVSSCVHRVLVCRGATANRYGIGIRLATI